MPLQRRNTLRALLGAGLAALGAVAAPAALAQAQAQAQAQGQAFPSKTIKFVVPFGPGSGTD
ncbi:MAG: tripartite tricarboxylate transporter substrate binding protein, partial [Proteobacteria bacterium]|nr:tripartite tricarboxylate transporter substrate binding protein [Pseudomonadota bacterium]